MSLTTTTLSHSRRLLQVSPTRIVCFAIRPARLLAAAAVAEKAADSMLLYWVSLCRKHLDFELLVEAHVRVEGQFLSQFHLWRFQLVVLRETFQLLVKNHHCHLGVVKMIISQCNERFADVAISW